MENPLWRPLMGKSQKKKKKIGTYYSRSKSIKTGQKNNEEVRNHENKSLIELSNTKSALPSPACRWKLGLQYDGEFDDLHPPICIV